MFFAGNLKNTTKYKENKNHLDPTTITLSKSTFLGIASVSGEALLDKVCKKMPRKPRCCFKIWVH